MRITQGSASWRTGFTFIEILVSVTIVAVLVAIGIASYASINRRSRDAKRKSDLEQIRASLEQYRADNGGYPPTVGWIISNPTDSNWIGELTPEYMDAVPVDPINSGSAPGVVPPLPVYAYRANADGGCGVSAGREFILAAVLETGEERTTTYGSCENWSQAGWYALGEQ